MKKLAVFASGNGSNAEAIAAHFYASKIARVDLILCNKSGAGVLDRAKRLNITSLVFSKNELNEKNAIVEVLQERGIDLIILAGFLLKVPDTLIRAYPKKIINIHPALLPKFGGKGMYGHHVHEAVIAAKEKKSGITIHYVNEQYDEGEVIFQASCEVDPDETAESLAAKIHTLEHQHFPSVIESILLSD